MDIDLLKKKKRSSATGRTIGVLLRTFVFVSVFPVESFMATSSCSQRKILLWALLIDFLTRDIVWNAQRAT